MRHVAASDPGPVSEVLGTRRAGLAAALGRLTRPAVALYRFRELMALLVARDLKARYKRSLGGMAWTLLNPLLQMAVYTLVFSTVVRIQVPGYAVYVLAGLLPWTLLSVGTVSASHSLLGNQALIRKVAVPQAVYPLSVVGGKLVDVVLSLGPLAAVAALQGRPPGTSWLALPLAVLLAAGFTAGLGLLMSSLTVFFRDLRHLVEVLFQIWFYLTPILYPASYLEAIGDRWVRGLFALNPATPIVRLFQLAVHEGRLPRAGELSAAALIAAAVLALGLAVFHRAESRHIHWF
jgi:ABC-type polysaccharide/polyol phosphate export permease